MRIAANRTVRVVQKARGILKQRSIAPRGRARVDVVALACRKVIPNAVGSPDGRAAVAANNLASIMVDENDNLNEALRLAQVARAGLPESPQVGDTLGWIYYKQGLTSHAITFLEESVKLDPQTAAYHYHLGLAYGKNGDVPAARQSLGTALKLNPTAPEAQEARNLLQRFAAAGL